MRPQWDSVLEEQARELLALALADLCMSADLQIRAGMLASRIGQILTADPKSLSPNQELRLVPLAGMLLP